MTAPKLGPQMEGGGPREHYALGVVHSLLPFSCDDPASVPRSLHKGLHGYPISTVPPWKET